MEKIINTDDYISVWSGDKIIAYVPKEIIDEFLKIYGNNHISMLAGAGYAFSHLTNYNQSLKTNGDSKTVRVILTSVDNN